MSGRNEHFTRSANTSTTSTSSASSLKTETEQETDSEVEGEDKSFCHQNKHTHDDPDEDFDQSPGPEYDMSDGFDSDASYDDDDESYEDFDSEAESEEDSEVGTKATRDVANQESDACAVQIINDLKYSSTIFESSFFSVCSDEIIQRIGRERKLEIFNFFVKNSDTLEEAAYMPIIYTLLGYLQDQKDRRIDILKNIDDLFDLVEPQIRETFKYFKKITFSRKVLARKFLQFLQTQSVEGEDFLSKFDSYKGEIDKYCGLFDDIIKNIETDKTTTENEKKLYGSISDSDDDDEYDSDYIRRRLLPPYFRSADGLLSVSVPFDDLAEFPYIPYKCWNYNQLKSFQDIIVDAYIGRKLYFINARYELLKMDLDNSLDGKITTFLSKCSFEIRREIDYNILSAWKFEQEMLVLQNDIVPSEIQNSDINWLEVSSSMYKRGVRCLNPEECLSFWLKIKSLFGKLKRDWSKAEINDLLNLTDPGREKEIVFDGIDAVKVCTCDLTVKLKCDTNHHSRNWNRVACQLGNGLTSFECLLAYREVVVSNHNTRVLQNKLKENLQDSVTRIDGLPDWTSICKELRNMTCGLSTCNKEELNTYHIKCLDPKVLHSHRYSLAEDSLLLAYVIKLGPRIEYEDNFNCIKPYLPWRTLEVWVTRFNILFGETTPWTLEQDMYILKCIHAYGMSHWAAISKSMDGRKSRNTIRSRFRRLTNNLKFNKAQKSGYFNRFFVADKNWMTRFIKIRYFLKEIYTLRESGQVEEIEFKGFSQLRPPTENEIKLYLITRDQSLLKDAIDHIENMLSMAEYDGLINMPRCGINVDLSKYIDRGQFVRTDPASVASALHLRRIGVKAIEELENPTDFEKAVIIYHLKFTLGRKVKPTTRQNVSLPKDMYLRSLPELKRILLSSPIPKIPRRKGQMTFYDRYCNRKNKILGGETEEKNKRTDNETTQTSTPDTQHKEQSKSNSTGIIPESEIKLESQEPNLFEKILSRKGRKSYKIGKMRRAAAKIRWAKAKAGEPLGTNFDGNGDNDQDQDQGSTSKRIKSEDTLQEP